MARYSFVALILAFAMTYSNAAVSQRFVRPPTMSPIPVLPAPTPIPRMDDRLLLPTPPVIVLPAPLPKPRPPDAGLCCLCPGTNECRDTCCFKR